MSNGSQKSSRSKVARVIQRYGLDAEGDRLVAEWTAPEDERSSLRDLAESFNLQILEAAMGSAGIDPIDGDVANVYRLLTDDDVSRGTKVEIRNRLEDQGLDIDRLTSDFVTRQAVHTYLRKHRNVEYESPETSDEDRIEDRRETIQRLRNRVTVVTERILGELGDAGLLSIGTVDVRVSVRVYCTDCGTQYDVLELLDAGGCEC